jgi:hypothetical protein
VQYLSPPKPAGLDPPPPCFAGIPQIGCGKLIAKKKLKKISLKIFGFFSDFFGQIFSMLTRSVAFGELIEDKKYRDLGSNKIILFLVIF